MHLDLVREVLTSHNIELVLADSGEAGLAAFRAAAPDLVIMDIAMPGLDGWETARRLRAEHGDSAPILMVSANVHDFQRPRRADDPHDDFLLKPYEVETLIERVFLLLDFDRVEAE